LIKAIHTALKAATGTSLCIFIDGLDEWEGRYDDLVDLVFKLQTIEHVKLCVASRPETDLRLRLKACKQMRMQAFNHADIAALVEEKLSLEEWLEIPRHPLHGDFPLSRDDAVAKIVYRADGVFPWAVLVTQSLITVLRMGDTSDMLRQRLEQMPKELNELYSRLWSNIDEIHKRSLSFYFVALQAARETFAWSRNICNLTAARLDVPIHFIQSVRIGLRTDQRADSGSKRRNA
jgi:hypothetical protein